MLAGAFDAAKRVSAFGGAMACTMTSEELQGTGFFVSLLCDFAVEKVD